MAVREGIEDLVLHLPAPILERAEEMASRECLSLNLFLVIAVAEKLQRLQLDSCFETESTQESGREARSGVSPNVH